MNNQNSEGEISVGAVIAWITGGLLVFVLLVIVAPVFWLFNGRPEWERYQARQNAENQVLINEIIIKQQEQNIQVEKQKAAIRIVDAQGIAEAQRIINATLTDKYLQHEAIQAQLAQVGSPNHTVIYIPSGQNGIPLVQTVNAP